MLHACMHAGGSAAEVIVHSCHKMRRKHAHTVYSCVEPADCMQGYSTTLEAKQHVHYTIATG